MAFKDTYVPPVLGGDFVAPAEKAELVASGDSFPITGVRFKASTKQDWPDQYYIDIELDGEGRTLTFGKGSGVGTRDDLCEKLMAYFEVDSEPVLVTLRKEGKSFLLDLV
jgi:hypothetical protein